MSSEEDELLHELEHDYETRDSILLRDRIFLTLSFSLSGGSFQLVTTAPASSGSTSDSRSFLGPEPLIELRFDSLCFSTDLRPRLRYASVDLSLGSLSVEDHSDSESLFQTLVKPKGEEKSQMFERQQYRGVDPMDCSSEGTLFGLRVIVEEVNHQKLIQ